MKKESKEDRDFINADGGNPDFRKKVLDLYKKKRVSLIILEPGCFDYGIVRVGQKRDGYAAVYDYDKMVSALADAYMKWNLDDKKYDREQAEMDAVDWVEYNTIRSIPYIKNKDGIAPKIVTLTERGREKAVV